MSPGSNGSDPLNPYTWARRKQLQPDVAEKYCVRVDVTEEFLFLASKMPPYDDR